MFTGFNYSLPENPIVRAYESCGGLGAVGPRGGLGSLGAFFPYAKGWQIENQIAAEGPGLGSLGSCCSSCASGAACCGGDDHKHRQNEGFGTGMNPYGLRGMGDLSTMFDDLSATLQSPSPVMGIPWLWLAGGAALLFFLSSRVDSSDYKYQKAKATRDYKAKLKELREDYPTRAGYGYRRYKELRAA